MNILSTVGTPEQAESLLNVLWPLDLTLEDEQDLETVEEYETVGIKD